MECAMSGVTVRTGRASCATTECPRWQNEQQCLEWSSEWPGETAMVCATARQQTASRAIAAQIGRIDSQNALDVIIGLDRPDVEPIEARVESARRPSRRLTGSVDVRIQVPHATPCRSRNSGGCPVAASTADQASPPGKTRRFEAVAIGIGTCTNALYQMPIGCPCARPSPRVLHCEQTGRTTKHRLCSPDGCAQCSSDRSTLDSTGNYDYAKYRSIASFRKTPISFSLRFPEESRPNSDPLGTRSWPALSATTTTA